MAHSRNRCVYCDDARGADVDHFAPIDHDHTQAFSWDNHLWSCPECNRRKSTKFPIAAGEPTLLNPVTENWWSLLTLDTATGVLAPRYVGGGFDPRGKDTLEVFQPVNFESVIEGRCRAIRRIRRAADAAVDEGDKPDTRTALARAVAEDDYGVAQWFALAAGRDESAFAALRVTRPGIWRRFVLTTVARTYGV